MTVTCMHENLQTFTRAVHHVTMALFLLSTATATLELTQDSWATEVSDSGKSAFVK